MGDKEGTAVRCGMGRHVGPGRLPVGLEMPVCSLSRPAVVSANIQLVTRRPGFQGESGCGT